MTYPKAMATSIPSPNAPGEASSSAQSKGSSPRPPSGTGDVLAQLLVQDGHLTPKQLVYAKRVQAKLTTPKTLIKVLKDLQYISSEQLSNTLRCHHTSLRLGDLLVELGYIGQSELEAALNLQSSTKEKKALGEILVEHRFIEEQKLAEVLSYQLGLPFVELELSSIDKALLMKANAQIYAEHYFLPVHQQEGHILVAFVDPLDRAARGTAEKIFGPDIISGIATKRAVAEVISLYHRGIKQVKPAATDESTVVGIVNTLFVAALREQASDIHIEPTADRLRVRFRCDGVLIHHKDLPKQIAAAMSSRIKILAKADITERRRHQDGRILFEDPQQGIVFDMRASFYVTIHGEKIVLRLLSKKGELIEIDDIGMAPKMLERFREDALDVPSGVVIITGPTGSGKTTSLYSAVNYLNNMHTSIITAEDPVEYVIEGIAQCSINPKLNVTFEETLRHIVRQDPDVIVLGEIRDRFSAETAIQAALTGHKVLTTFHTEDSIGGLLRLLNMDIEAFLISSTVVCVVAQRLLRRVCQHCAEPSTPAPLELRRLSYGTHDLQGAHLSMGRGCTQCRFTGYRGRVGIFELLVLNEMVKDAILNRKTSYEIRRISLETSGLVTLIEDGIVKAARGETTLQEILRHLPRLHKPRPLHELNRILGG